MHCRLKGNGALSEQMELRTGIGDFGEAGSRAAGKALGQVAPYTDRLGFVHIELFDSEAELVCTISSTLKGSLRNDVL